MPNFRNLVLTINHLNGEHNDTNMNMKRLEIFHISAVKART